MKRLVFLAAVALTLSTLSLTGEEPDAKSRPANQLGLSRTDVFATPVAPPSRPNRLAPGEGEVVPRPYPGAPPVISHAVDDFLPITWEDNACVTCHGDPDMGATLLPESHYVDLRNAPKVVRKEIAGARYQCMLCHVPQGGATPPVGNRF